MFLIYKYVCGRACVRAYVQHSHSTCSLRTMTRLMLYFERSTSRQVSTGRRVCTMTSNMTNVTMTCSTNTFCQGAAGASGHNL